MKIDAELLDTIQEVAENFADHERMNEANILRWVRQFDDGDRHLVKKLLESIDYFGTSRIRGMTQQLVDITLQELGDVTQTRLFFVATGSDYEGSRVVIRALRDIRRKTKANWRILTMTEAAALQSSEVDAIVFVDDFSGTGNKLVEWWKTVESLFLPKDATLVVALLVMNYLAEPRILEFADEAVHVKYLDEEDNALSPKSRRFDAAEREFLLHYCRRTGVTAELIEGYGRCGLLIAFKHGCPNNSLPVLWSRSASWAPLFQRSAL